MTLRVPRDGGPVVLTLPAHVALSDGAAFAEAKARWLLQATERRPAPSIVRHGVVLPLAGMPLVLTPAAVRVAEIAGDVRFMGIGAALIACAALGTQYSGGRLGEILPPMPTDPPRPTRPT